jgi:hypothetical protein
MGGWIIPTGKALLDNKEHVLKAWEKLEALLLGKKSRILVTGIAGAGKTVLADFLTGRGYRRGYCPPLKSRRLELSRFRLRRRRLALSVVPGDSSRQRSEALQGLVQQKKPVVGVIHVVPNGFVSVRDSEARRALIEDQGIKTVEALRAYIRQQEIEDLRQTCSIVRQSITANHTPTWIVVAVTKADLFRETLAEAKQYYSPHAHSPFAEVLRTLHNQVGADNFQWDAVPICTWLEPFSWGVESVQSVMSAPERDAFVGQFIDLLETFCER